MLQARQRPPLSARTTPVGVPDRLGQVISEAELAIAEPLRGIVSSRGARTGLFPISSSGVSAEPLRSAAIAFLDALSPAQQKAALFPVDGDAWRRWCNMHPYFMRHGVCLEELDEVQTDRALELVAASLSDDGFTLARDIMRLNETLREITRSDDEYGEWLYWISVMGRPSETEPWGFQIDGHHLIVNCFVLGDQVVMTPMFLGSEPTRAETGKYAGTRVFELEERRALELAKDLSPAQYEQALLGLETPSEVFTTCYRDNFEMNYEGIAFADLNDAQQRKLLDLVGRYVHNIRPGHSGVRMREVEQHLDDTFFAWMGEATDDGVFYYRVHSPVILIEFDHESGVALDNDEPSRNHIHAVVRTPNGNDYGADLLRQHYERAHSGART